ncbi:MAG: hypothetical protein AB7L13_19540 [Acidimicrobiia bacterium]
MSERSNGAVFWFTTDAFVDDAASVAKRVNANVGGEALAIWLSGALRSIGIHAGEPWAEDHGYDFSITSDSRAYLCTCHYEDDDEATTAERDAAVSITPVRSLKDRLSRARPNVDDDRLEQAVIGVLAAHPDVRGLRREP